MTEETQVTPLEARISEVAQYKANIALYKTILETLPKEWPSHLEQYRGSKEQHQTITEVGFEDVELLSQLWYADECHKAIRSEIVEMTKANSILNVLKQNNI
jgi:hypothetical protein